MLDCQALCQPIRPLNTIPYVRRMSTVLCAVCISKGTLGAYWPTIRLASIMALFMAFMTLMILMYFWVLLTYPPRKRPAADTTATV